jgi:hypothetical protein
MDWQNSDRRIQLQIGRISSELRLIFGLISDILVFAVLDGEVAVPCYPQSAVAGLNSCQRSWGVRTSFRYPVLTVGSFAMNAYEPGQVRKEAAVSKMFHVPKGSLT